MVCLLTACSASASEARDDRKSEAGRTATAVLRDISPPPATADLLLTAAGTTSYRGTVESAHVRHRPPGSPCAGYFAEAATARITVENNETIRLGARALDANDLTLAVRLPNGDWLCTDDGPTGRDPELVVTLPAGVTTVFVGSYASMRSLDFELYSEASARPAWKTCAANRSFTPAIGATVTTRGALSQPLHRCAWLLDAPRCAWLLPEEPAACLLVTERMMVTVNTEKTSFDTVMAVQSLDTEGKPASERWLNDDASDVGTDSGLSTVLLPGRYGIFVGTYRHREDGTFHLRITSDTAP